MAVARYRTIADAIAAQIRDGRLAPGTQLPTVRSLMQQHSIALATAYRIYTELEAAGLAVGETGRGTFVRDISLPRVAGLLQETAQRAAVDLSFNYPMLPGQVEMLRDGLRGLAASGDLDTLLHLSPQGGRPQERSVAARHLRNRGIRVPAEQVLIVNGAQQGLATAVMALLKPGDLLAVDALTYPGLKALAQAHRLELCSVPMVNGCTDLDELERLCRKRPVRAIYTMPTMHNPLGSIMSISQRTRLVEIAQRHDLLIIEDGAYAFLAEPAPRPLFTLAPQRTVYVSGLSKSVAAGLRIGIVAAPLSLISALEMAIRVTSWNTPSLTVALACRWIESGEVDALEEGKREDARQRQRWARNLLRGCDVTSHPSSYYLWLGLPQGLRCAEVAAQLQSNGVSVTTAVPFATTKHAPQALRLAIGTVSLERLKLALTKVRTAVS
jgi:DNA-binding transcriptional MocR family regulator